MRQNNSLRDIRLQERPQKFRTKLVRERDPMAKHQYMRSPPNLTGMPPGVPYIIGNEAAERFSYYGMKSVLTVFMALSS